MICSQCRTHIAGALCPKCGWEDGASVRQPDPFEEMTFVERAQMLRRIITIQAREAVRKEDEALERQLSAGRAAAE